MKKAELLRDSYDYEDYDKNVVVLSEEDLIDLNLIESYQAIKGNCCKTEKKGGCCKSAKDGNNASLIQIIKK